VTVEVKAIFTRSVQTWNIIAWRDSGKQDYV